MKQEARLLSFLFHTPCLIPLASCFLLLASSASALDLAAHGYYRTRSEFAMNLDTQEGRSDLANDDNRFGLIAFNQMRFRLEPLLKVNDFISIHSQFDILDNVVFGSEATKELEVLSPVVGTVTLPTGAGSLSMVGGEAGENKALNVRRVWGEVLTPVGKLKFGRQPSHWGLGIFQNDGNSRQGDFGDTADRLLFLTEYDIGDGGSITGGALWDIAYEAQRDPRIGGLADAIRDNGQDTHQYAALLLYEREEGAAGFFGGVRRRNGGSGTTTTAADAYGNNVAAGIDGDTLVYFFDGYGRVSWREYTFQIEGVYVGGKMSTGATINAIPFSIYYSADPANRTAGAGVINLPAKQDVQVGMVALDANGVYNWGGEWNLKSGFAQGDATPLSTKITQYGFRPDYNVALFMFSVPLGTSPSLWGCSATDGPGCASASHLTGGVPITGNYVNNAIYVSGGYKHHFEPRVKNVNDLSVGGRVTTAWAHKNVVDLDFPELLGDNTLPVIRNSGKWYGIELDITGEARIYDHFYAGLEGGVLIPGSAYDIKVDTPALGTIVQTVPINEANIAYGGRVTLMVEF